MLVSIRIREIRRLRHASPSPLNFVGMPLGCKRIWHTNPIKGGIILLLQEDNFNKMKHSFSHECKYVYNENLYFLRSKHGSFLNWEM